MPAAQLDAVAGALQARLEKTTVGDPGAEGVRMGPLVGRDQARDVRASVEQLASECEVIYGGGETFPLTGTDNSSGAFFPPTLLRCDDPHGKTLVHEVEAFGPVSTLIPYQDIDDAIAITRLGKGSLVGSLFTFDDAEARQVILGTAPWHGRMLIINRDCAGESTGHGSPLAPLVHGGPGRAGGGEELRPAGFTDHVDGHYLRVPCRGPVLLR